jgi:hypothetical protein
MKKTKLKKPILAEGEVTGHYHALEKGVDVYEREDGLKQFKLTKSTKLNHQEHKTIELPIGEYLSDQVVETDHILDQVRKVAD